MPESESSLALALKTLKGIAFIGFIYLGLLSALEAPIGLLLRNGLFTDGLTKALYGLASATGKPGTWDMIALGGLAAFNVVLVLVGYLGLSSLLAASPLLSQGYSGFFRFSLGLSLGLGAAVPLAWLILGGNFLAVFLPGLALEALLSAVTLTLTRTTTRILGA